MSASRPSVFGDLLSTLGLRVYNFITVRAFDWLKRRYLQKSPGAVAEVGVDWHQRVIVATVLSALAVVASLMVAQVLIEKYANALVLCFVSLVLLALLEAGRKVSGSAVTHLVLVTIGLAEISAAFFDPVLDTAVLLWFAVLPMMASLLLNQRAAVVWLFIGFAAATAVFVIRPPPTIESLGALHLIRLGFFAVVVFIFLLLFDFSRRKALEGAQAANRAKSTFLATMSHEIRTPMNGVLGMAEVMLQGELTPIQRDQLGVIQRSGQALLALLNDILDVSKVEARKLTLDSRPFELRTMLAELIQLHATLAEARALTMTMHFASGVPAVVMGDALRLRQVLGNLLANAVKFTQRGSVELRVTLCADAKVHFAVVDTGVGISAEGLKALFQPFSQIDSSATRRFAGTGLGLALSHQLVELMGGRLTVTSSVGRGSSFEFELMLKEGVLPPARPEVTNSPSRRGHLVLVVDDNTTNQAVASAFLRKEGFDVELASDGEQAVAAATQRPFALILMDCHMPRMDGLEATARIRALDSPAARTPIIALTASAMPEELEVCRRAGMNACLTKPLVYAQLHDIMQRYASPGSPLKQE